MAVREERVRVLLDQLAVGLRRGRTEGLAAPSASGHLGDIEANVRNIGFSTLELRFVASGENPGQSAAVDTWVADVQVTWRFRGYDPTESVLEVPFVVVDDGRAARFGGLASADGDRVPVWLLERLAVAKTGRVLALAAQHRKLPGLTRLARAAVAAVDRVLPDWRGTLVLVEPSSSQALDRAVGTEPGTTAQLAGVTTTVDGTVARGGTSQVLLNPDVFDRLGPRARAIVVAHEAAHVATDAAVSPMPQWLAEGFADYVALRDTGLPVEVSAGQILAEVRRDGPPAELPAAGEFASGETGLGAQYESAWLACRLIAERYGERALVALYRHTDRDGDVGQAFRAVLGTTERSFTRTWRGYLVDLAA